MQNFDFFDTTAKQQILEYFRHNKKKKMSTLELSKELNMPQSTINRALNSLEKSGILNSEDQGKFKLFLIEQETAKDMEHVFDYLENVKRFTLEQRKKKRGVEPEG